MNITKTVKRIEEAADSGGQIILLQELFNTTYFYQQVDDKFFVWGQPVTGPVTGRLTKLAKELEAVMVALFLSIWLILLRTFALFISNSQYGPFLLISRIN